MFLNLIMRALIASALGSCFGVALILASQPANAQGRDSYVGIGVGSSDYDTAFKVYGGAPLHPSFGWEGQYINFGRESVTVLGNTTKSSAWAIGASAVGYLPFQNNFTGFGKVGLHHVRAEVKGPVLNASDSSFEVGLGVGVRWQFAPQYSMRLEVENYGGDGGDVISFGMQMKF